jgi:hypothetical protein
LDDRANVLTEGRYTYYRERTATVIGDLATLIEQKHKEAPVRLILDDENDAQGKKKKSAVSGRLKGIKGLGPLGRTRFVYIDTVLWATSIA